MGNEVGRAILFCERKALIGRPHKAQQDGGDYTRTGIFVSAGLLAILSQVLQRQLGGGQNLLQNKA